VAGEGATVRRRVREGRDAPSLDALGDSTEHRGSREDPGGHVDSESGSFGKRAARRGRRGCLAGPFLSRRGVLARRVVREGVAVALPAASRLLGVGRVARARAARRRGLERGDEDLVRRRAHGGRRQRRPRERRRERRRFLGGLRVEGVRGEVRDGEEHARVAGAGVAERLVCGRADGFAARTRRGREGERARGCGGGQRRRGKRNTAVSTTGKRARTGSREPPRSSRRAS